MRARIIAAHLALLTSPALAEPAWLDADLTEAVETGETQHKPVLLYLTSPACLACRQMDEATWPDAALTRAVARRTVPVRPPADAVRDAMAALDVHCYPALVLVRDGRKVAQLTGFRDPQSVLAWLDDPGSFGRAPDPADPVGAVHDLAMDLLSEGNLPEAARALAEVWRRVPAEPGATRTLRWLRRDRYPTLLHRVAEDPKARPEVEALLLGYPPAGPTPADNPELIADWITLQTALGRTDLLDAWLGATLATPGGPEALSRQPRAFDRLADLERWPDAGRVASPALWDRWVARVQGRPTGDDISDAAPAPAADHERGDAPHRLARFVRALRAASRDAEADALAAVI